LLLTVLVDCCLKNLALSHGKEQRAAAVGKKRWHPGIGV
jgi:hypothetical protein